ncbi:MAG: fasciclin domain-containing protein [Chitinophagales bacterium]
MRNRLFQFSLLILTSLSIASCSKDDEMPVQQTVYELAKSTPDLSSLTAALEKAGLDDDLNSTSASFTVFAPTNAAFATFLSANGFANLDAVPTDVLTSILLNHVVNSEKKAADLTTGYLKTLATYNGTSNINLYVNTASGVVLNGGPKVTIADVDASNGVVHIVDAVIGLPTVVTFAASNPDFSLLVEALTRPDLSVNFVEILSGSGPFTVFAPTNAAFSALLTELGVSSINDIDAATLETVLTYHVASGNVLAGSLTEGQVVTTLQTGTFTISLTGGAKIIDFNSRVSNIIATDIQASNGVVHAIDKVLLPQL